MYVFNENFPVHRPSFTQNLVNSLFYTGQFPSSLQLSHQLRNPHRHPASDLFCPRFALPPPHLDRRSPRLAWLSRVSHPRCSRYYFPFQSLISYVRYLHIRLRRRPCFRHTLSPHIIHSSGSSIPSICCAGYHDDDWEYGLWHPYCRRPLYGGWILEGIGEEWHF